MDVGVVVTVLVEGEIGSVIVDVGIDEDEDVVCGTVGVETAVLVGRECISKVPVRIEENVVGGGLE